MAGINLLQFSYILEGLIGLLVVFLVITYWRTPAWVFLMGWMKNKTVTVFMSRQGNRFRLPDIQEAGVNIFKNGKNLSHYFIFRDSSIPIGSVKLGWVMDERAGYVHPRFFDAARSLRLAGIRNYTEAEIAFMIRSIEKEKGIKITEKSKIRIQIKNERGELITQEIPIKDYLINIAFVRGINPNIMDLAAPINSLLKCEGDEEGQERFRRIDGVENEFYILSDYFKYRLNPSTVAEKINLERSIAMGLKNMEEKKGGISFMTILTIFIVLIGLAVAAVILNSQFHIFGGAPAAVVKTATTTLTTTTLSGAGININ